MKTVIFFWVIITMLLILVGTLLSADECDARRLTRIEYILPGIPIGCWLGEVP